MFSIYRNGEPIAGPFLTREWAEDHLALMDGDGEVRPSYPERGSVELAVLVVLAAVLPLLTSVSYFTAQMFGALRVVA